MDDEEVELLVSDFPCLENLSISGSKLLRNVSIVGHSALKLKHLSIISNANWSFKSIMIDSMINLVSLRIFYIPNRETKASFRYQITNTTTTTHSLKSLFNNIQTLINILTSHSLHHFVVSIVDLHVYMIMLLDDRIINLFCMNLLCEELRM